MLIQLLILVGVAGDCIGGTPYSPFAKSATSQTGY